MDIQIGVRWDGQYQNSPYLVFQIEDGVPPRKLTRQTSLAMARHWIQGQGGRLLELGILPVTGQPYQRGTMPEPSWLREQREQMEGRAVVLAFSNMGMSLPDSFYGVDSVETLVEWAVVAIADGYVYDKHDGDRNFRTRALAWAREQWQAEYDSWLVELKSYVGKELPECWSHVDETLKELGNGRVTSR